MRLLKNGVPWTEAWAMSATRRAALIVAAREIDGAEYDWETSKWKEPTP